VYDCEKPASDFGEFHHYFRFASIRKKNVLLAQQQQLFYERFVGLQELMVATS
jgi:hypothetical protein